LATGYHDWNGQPPRSAELGDHDVPLASQHLLGRRIALVVTGGIAALRTPDLARALRRRGAEVTAFCSADALPFVGRQALEWATCRPLITSLGWRAEHLSDGEAFDAWLVAPATANTLAKLACGIADTPVSAALASALGRMERGRTQLLLAPTMHGSLHTSILTDHVRRLRDLGVHLIAPRDAYGKHNLPDADVLVACVCRALATGPLRGRRILVTGGPTPVAIDGVRRIVNRFSGRLATAIAAELLLRGADPQLLLGEGSTAPPAWLPHRWLSSYDAYRDQVLAAVGHGAAVAGEPGSPAVLVRPGQGSGAAAAGPEARQAAGDPSPAPQQEPPGTGAPADETAGVAGVPLAAAILSAAVADYQPRQVHPGKLASGQPRLSLELEPTAKVVDLLRRAAPALPMVTFKVLQGASDETLLAEARRRLERFQLVVANHAEQVEGAEQTAWLVSGSGASRHQGKEAIARAIADWLEGHLGSGS
jgi:phosphopantothenoylcysteine decarboxylase/phosphopantothenate--cysteine ligase